jgi:hypothetical protein
MAATSCRTWSTPSKGIDTTIGKGGFVSFHIDGPESPTFDGTNLSAIEGTITTAAVTHLKNTR